ncbi:MAG: helix-turn-helix domain-containing protein [Mycobacterium sp.]
MRRAGDSNDTESVSLSAAQIDALAAAIAAAIQPTVWLTPDEAAEVLTVPAATLAQWRYRGHGPRYSKIGAVVRYSRRDLDSWLAAAAVEPRYA